ncbi:hypothetical protein [Vibrio phage vB_VpaP_M83]|nr:hypothetical protein [Vibrio phage vB_VpaP_M83]
MTYAFGIGCRWLSCCQYIVSGKLYTDFKPDYFALTIHRTQRVSTALPVV